MQRFVPQQFAALAVLVAFSADFAAAQWQSTVLSFQTSQRFYGPNATDTFCVGVGITDKSGANLVNVLPTTTGAGWALARNSVQGPNATLEWQGTYTYRGPATPPADDFTVASSNSVIRQLGDEITARWYDSCLATTGPVTAVNFGLSFGPQQNDDDIRVEGLPDIPIRSIRLELFETAAGMTPVGSVVHSVEYENPFEVDPFLAVRNLHYRPVHFMASTGTFDFPLEIGNHDDYAAMIGMVGDGVMRSLPAAGDFNEDGVYSIEDMDELSLQIFEASLGATVELKYDLTGDGDIDPADGERWLANAGAVNNVSGNPYLPTDANLDGVVDGSDFNLWNAHKFTPNPQFSRGDWNYDGIVDGSDFNLWNAHKFNASDSTAAVPEPGTMMSWFMGICVWLSIRRVVGQ